MPDHADLTTSADVTTSAELLNSVIDEFLHSYAHGARLVAVSSPDRDRSAAFAAQLAAAFTSRGITATSVTPDAPDADTLRSEVVGPFRSARANAVLIVAGDAGLLDDTRRGMWHFSIWLLAGDEKPHTAATALVDVTDPQHPFRQFADYC
ncbi:hypothetical protein QF046_003235 [Microbacterium sp. W4I4]|uniref:hypothetical protein n=1 Tax=Microbacterium sp. W4I4 TaxID=3042295 RepID=UPI00278AFACD|nr:hypothetical protein [Microbacterium sp. W4I4]MDQ0615594.1 hypothetical protein [Microbacterium sp. W4I4]